MPRHFLSIADTSTDRLRSMLLRAVALRSGASRPLAGKVLCCLFEKPSLRTRVSFEQAMRRLGGEAMSMGQQEVGLGGRECPEDVARVLGTMVDVVMARVKCHSTLERMAATDAVPIVNGLSDLAHPAQALADLLTMMDEFCPGDTHGLRGRSLVFVGDGNNVARSLAVACSRLDMKFTLCAPARYMLDRSWIERVERSAPGWRLSMCDDPEEGVSHADAIYCDTFVSMGQEEEKEERLREFRAYQVNEDLVSKAPAHAIVLHCLPAYRGVEITDGVMDGPRSRVFRQAGNRLDAQMGLLAELLAPEHAG